MIRGINQTMVNRYISGGGNCKCVNGGINGSNTSGGKIEVEIPVYDVDGKGTIKQEDAERLFNEIVSLDPEKYTFYQVIERYSDAEIKMINILSYSCDYMYNQGIDMDGVFDQINAFYNQGDVLINIIRKNTDFDYEYSNINENKISVDPIQDTATYSIFKYILYYREL